ncbi:MutS-related protein [Psychroflexus salis]|uniref:DNA mismatch repair protein MutS n=1 Tax=Psychroflexus salis TaxID=1526574 RepID=A0A917E6H9_9FLAO|nr:DNA mismatch repair protein MutS [Psychroflexus salis]GGE05341.1 DNA mismatch repair protein MutS [Psychroflexus salis]
MENVKQIYQERITAFNKAKNKIQQQLLIFSLLRLSVFAICVFLIFQFWGEARSIGLIVVISALVFIMLIRFFAKAKYEKQKLEALIQINKTEQKTNLSNFGFYANGEQYQDGLHEFSEDTDLFGERSFFQYINRTQLVEGERNLANQLKSNHIKAILDKQEFVKEMAQKIDFRQEFAAHAQLLQTEEKIQTIITWINTYKTHVPKWMKWFPYVFSLASLVVIFLFFTEIIQLTQFLLWIFIGLVITGFYIKKSNALSQALGRVQASFQQYAKLLQLIEDAEFTSKKGRAYQTQIKEDQQNFSVLLQQFSKQIDNFEQRNNMLLGLVFNGFFLWDLMQSYKIEQWILAHRLKVENVFNVIADLDAWCSLGNFCFNHIDYVFPEINTKATTQLQVDKAIHPLLNTKITVANDIGLEAKNFVILTGANMAGKSTFLRTLALQIIMANTGLPVRASKCIYRPIKLITSMRTSDSLADESSYFYAELTRLKQIVDTLQKEPYFVILDEILKGTNSKDKAIGAQKFVKRLWKENAVGIIATHDLSLCSLADESTNIENYYFDAEIENDELHFDYTLKKGICQNMNASFLLEKMGLV